MSDAVVLKASIHSIKEGKAGHLVSFRVPTLTQDQEHEVTELEKLKKERLFLVVVTEAEYGLITGEHH